MTDSLQRTWAVAKKEIYSYSISPAFYGIAIFFLLFTSIWLFVLQRFFMANTASLRAYFAAFPLAFIGVIPALTMKSWAEERKTGSIELLITLPFSEWNVTLGKFIAALVAVAVMFVFSLPVPFTLLPLGNFDGGVIFAEYIGALLLAASAIALGLLFSALSKNQAGAFLASAVVLVFFMLASQIPWVTNLPAWLAEAIKFLSLSYHFESFSKGLLDSRDLVFFILSSFLFLFINTRIILFRKWR
ncbi:MAG: ABC transporter permease subunit [Spirochaetaceae bacterium]|jgi:ABC-2 type transport system permease protein|nr:ABC transporter permease subunit [Spirochaetaceae bacterium]